MQLSGTVHHCGWQQVSNTVSIVQPFLQVIRFKSLWLLAIYFAFLGNIKHEDKLTDRLPRDDEHHKKSFININWLNSCTCYAEWKKLLHYINRLTDAFIMHMRKNKFILKPTMLAVQQYWISRVNQSRRVCPEKRETGENTWFFSSAFLLLKIKCTLIEIKLQFYKIVATFLIFLMY